MKKLALLLALVMVLSLFAGCSSTDETTGSAGADDPATTETTDDSATADDTTEDAEPEPEVEEEPEETFDYGGMEIVIAAPWETDLTPGVSVGTDNLIERIAEVEAKYNVKIVYKNCKDDQIGGNYFELAVQGMLSGESLGDILYCRTGDYVAWKNAGVLQDLSQFDHVLDLGNTTKWSELTLKNTSENGAVYGLKTNPLSMYTFITFNKRLFDEAGVAYPYEYIADDNWNFNTLAEVAKQLTLDKDGDGTIDQYGFTAYNQAAVGHCMIIANGGQIIEEDADGFPLFVADQPKTMEALNIFHNWYNVENFCVPLTEGGEWDAQVKLFEQAEVAMMVSSEWMLGRYYNNLPDEFGVALFPQGPSAEGKYMAQHGKLDFMVMPVTTDKDQEAIARVYSALMEPFGDDPLETYIEGHEEKLYDDESLETLLSLQRHENGAELVFSGVANYALDWSAPADVQVSPHLFNRIVNGEAPSAVIEEKKTAVQAYLDDLFK